MNSCAIQFPLGYSLVESDEMMYIEGGAYKYFNISSGTCNKVAGLLDRASLFASVAAEVLAAVVGVTWFVPGVNISLTVTANGIFALTVGGYALSLGSSAFYNAAARGGLYIGFDIKASRKLVWGYGNR